MCEFPLLVVRRRQHLIWRSEFSQERKKSDFWHIVFITGCLFYQRFLFVAVCFTRNRTNMFSGIWKSEKNPATCAVQGFHYCVRPECWQDFTHCFWVQFFHRQHVTSTMMWCLQMRRTLWVSRRGNTCRPKTIQGFNMGLFFLFLFFSLTNGKLSPPVRDKMPQTWSKFDRLPESCAVCHPQL